MPHQVATPYNSHFICAFDWQNEFTDLINIRAFICDKDKHVDVWNAGKKGIPIAATDLLRFFVEKWDVLVSHFMIVHHEIDAVIDVSSGINRSDLPTFKIHVLNGDMVLISGSDKIHTKSESLMMAESLSYIGQEIAKGLELRGLNYDLVEAWRLARSRDIIPPVSGDEWALDFNYIDQNIINERANYSAKMLKIPVMSYTKSAIFEKAYHALWHRNLVATGEKNHEIGHMDGLRLEKIGLLPDDTALDAISKAAFIADSHFTAKREDQETYENWATGAIADYNLDVRAAIFYHEWPHKNLNNLFELNDLIVDDRLSTIASKALEFLALNADEALKIARP
jgi:hypothetical protein